MSCASELHPVISPFAERVCVGCGCTEENACVDEQTRLTCSWADVEDMDICTFCASIAARMAEADERDVAAMSDEPRVQIYGDHEAQQYIEKRRAMAAGGIA